MLNDSTYQIQISQSFNKNSFHFFLIFNNIIYPPPENVNKNLKITLRQKSLALQPNY